MGLVPGRFGQCLADDFALQGLDRAVFGAAFALPACEIGAFLRVVLSAWAPGRSGPGARVPAPSKNNFRYAQPRALDVAAINLRISPRSGRQGDIPVVSARDALVLRHGRPGRSSRRSPRHVGAHTSDAALIAFRSAWRQENCTKLGRGFTSTHAYCAHQIGRADHPVKISDCFRWVFLGRLIWRRNCVDQSARRPSWPPALFAASVIERATVSRLTCSAPKHVLAAYPKKESSCPIVRYAK